MKLYKKPVYPKNWERKNDKKITLWMQKLPNVKNLDAVIENDKKFNLKNL
jgi:hypothetical protein